MRMINVCTMTILLFFFECESFVLIEMLLNNARFITQLKLKRFQLMFRSVEL